MPSDFDNTPDWGTLAEMGLLKDLTTGREGKASDMILDFAPPMFPRKDLARTLAAPAVHTGGDKSLIQKIFDFANQKRFPDYPPATEPVVEQVPSSVTKQMVPQASQAHRLAPIDPTSSARVSPIYEARAELGRMMADDILAGPKQPEFYSTGGIYRGLEDIGGLSPDQSRNLMREWTGDIAATSPQTKTPPNQRNAGYLTFRRGTGDPLTTEVQNREQAAGMWGTSKVKDKKTGETVEKPNMNRPGFPMMNMHTTLAEEFYNDTVDAQKNSKPFIFRENQFGNMADSTVDTHNVRSIIDAYDRLNPGGLHRDWFENEDAYRRYTANKGFSREGVMPIADINATPANRTVNKRTQQHEFPLLQQINNEVANNVDISPAEAQERMWFLYGNRTGLGSPPMSTTDLFNSQVEQTAKATGLKPEAILRLWAQRRIPFVEADVSDVPGYSTVG